MLFTPVALAGKPEKLTLPPFELVVDLPGLDCPAAIAPRGVRWSDAGGNQAQTVFDNGTVMFTGRHPDQVTNVAIGKSVVLQLQGSVTQALLPDGSSEARLSGSTAITFLPGDIGPGDVATGRTYLFTGTARGVVDPTFTLTVFESSRPWQAGSAGSTRRRD